jgi:hypothetical protein
MEELGLLILLHMNFNLAVENSLVAFLAKLLKRPYQTHLVSRLLYNPSVSSRRELCVVYRKKATFVLIVIITSCAFLVVMSGTGTIWIIVDTD